MKKIYRGFALPVVLGLIWLLASFFSRASHPLFPAPSNVLTLLFSQFSSGEYATSLLWSLSRNLTGFITGMLCGLMTGLIMGSHVRSGQLLSPTFNFLKQISLLAWVPLLSMWFGQGEMAKVVLIAMASFYPMAVNTYAGMQALDKKLDEVAKIALLKPSAKFRLLTLPETSPYLYTGAHLSLIYSWVATIAAEYFFSSAPGVANIIIDGRDTLDMDKIISGMIIIAIVGYIINLLFIKLEKRHLHWIRK